MPMIGYYGASYSAPYISGPYANHSSIIAANYRPPTATISEAHAAAGGRPLTRIGSPLSSSKFKMPRPISINTADIDVSVNKYRKYKRPSRVEADEPPVNTSPRPEHQAQSPIKRDRAVVRLLTIRKRSRKRPDGDDKPQSWRDSFEELDPKRSERKTEKKSEKERLLEKHLIRDKSEEEKEKEEQRKREEEEEQRALTKSPSFHDICKSISSDGINEDLNPGQPDHIRKRQTRQCSSEDVLKKIRRDSAEILQENIIMLDKMLMDETMDKQVGVHSSTGDMQIINELKEGFSRTSVKRRKKITRSKTDGLSSEDEGKKKVRKKDRSNTDPQLNNRGEKKGKSSSSSEDDVKESDKQKSGSQSSCSEKDSSGKDKIITSKSNNQKTIVLNGEDTSQKPKEEKSEVLNGHLEHPKTVQNKSKPIDIPKPTEDALSKTGQKSSVVNGGEVAITPSASKVKPALEAFKTTEVKPDLQAESPKTPTSKLRTEVPKTPHIPTEPPKTPTNKVKPSLEAAKPQGKTEVKPVVNGQEASKLPMVKSKSNIEVSKPQEQKASSYSALKSKSNTELATTAKFQEVKPDVSKPNFNTSTGPTVSTNLLGKIDDAKTKPKDDVKTKQSISPVILSQSSKEELPKLTIKPQESLQEESISTPTEESPKSTLQRRGTVKKIRRNETNSFFTDIQTPDVQTEYDFQNAIRDISQVEVEEIKVKPKPIITSTVDVDAPKPNLKPVVDVEVEEKPKTKPQSPKFKLSFTIEDIEEKKKEKTPEPKTEQPETPKPTIPESKTEQSKTPKPMIPEPNTEQSKTPETKTEQPIIPEPKIPESQKPELNKEKILQTDMQIPKSKQPVVSKVINRKHTAHMIQMLDDIKEEEDRGSKKEMKPKSAPVPLNEPKSPPFFVKKVEKSASGPKIAPTKKIAQKVEEQTEETPKDDNINFWDVIGSRESVNFNNWQNKRSIFKKRVAAVISKSEDNQMFGFEDVPMEKEVKNEETLDSQKVIQEKPQVKEEIKVEKPKVIAKQPKPEIKEDVKIVKLKTDVMPKPQVITNTQKVQENLQLKEDVKVEKPKINEGQEKPQAKEDVKVEKPKTNVQPKSQVKTEPEKTGKSLNAQKVQPQIKEDVKVEKPKINEGQQNLQTKEDKKIDKPKSELQSKPPQETKEDPVSKATTTPPKDTAVPPQCTAVATKDVAISPKDTAVSPKDTAASPKDTTIPPKSTATAPKDTTVPPKDAATTAASQDEEVATPAKKAISKRSLVNKATSDDPDLTVFVVPEEPEESKEEPEEENQEGKFVPLQSNRMSDWMHPYKKPVHLDVCPVEIYATPKVIRGRHYPRPRHPPPPPDPRNQDDSDESEESEESEEETESESESSSGDETTTKAGTSTSSNDSGFDSSAPGSPSNRRQYKGSSDSRDSPASNPAHNPAYAVEDAMQEEYMQSSTYVGYQKSGRITPPATTIPRFRKYTIDDFQFLKVLGKGSFGKVMLAELKNTEYYYAVKCLKKDVVLEDDDVECTLIERKVLALGTKHPYLCHLLCTFQTESHLFFVMEYLNGGDLMFHIQQSGRFPEPRARFYAAEIASGLKFLHTKGIVYRDLKLDNILLDFDGHVRIADFGMCKLQVFLDRMADTFCGTPDYMAPEIIKGQHYNQCVDWWSYGVLLYEMLIGQSPFSGCDEDELFWSICNEKPVIPRFLSSEANSVVLLLLEKDASKRLGNKMCPAGDIQDQPFFQPINWNCLEARMLEPPFKPKLQHPLDTQYFDRTFTVEKAKLTPIEKNILQSMDQTQFQGFSYTNPNATDK